LQWHEARAYPELSNQGINTHSPFDERLLHQGYPPYNVFQVRDSLEASILNLGPVVHSIRKNIDLSSVF